MPKATIKTNEGSIITIEGTQNELREILAHFHQTNRAQEVKSKLSKQGLQKKEDKKRRTASDLIIELREEGFLTKPKSLGEIATELQRIGYVYPTTTLSGVVMGLVQKKQLGRKKENGKWVYGK